jgi:hypothetical protein
MHIKINNNRLQDKKTRAFAIRYRIHQEIKFLYCKKQNFNAQLYQLHLQCAYQCNGVWQLIYDIIDAKLTQNLESFYQKLNKKLDALTTQQSQTKNNNTVSTHTRFTWRRSMRLLEDTRHFIPKYTINSRTVEKMFLLDSETIVSAVFKKNYKDEMLKNLTYLLQVEDWRTLSISLHHWADRKVFWLGFQPL